MRLRARSSDLLVALVSLAIGAAILAFVPDEIAGQTLSAIGDMNSPAFFPIIAAALMVLCGAILALGSAARRQSGDDDWVTFKRPGPVLTVMAMFVLFATGTHYIGMVASSVITILVMAVFLGYRNLWVLVPVALLVPAVIYLLFERVLLILLPRGTLFT